MKTALRIVLILLMTVLLSQSSWNSPDNIILDPPEKKWLREHKGQPVVIGTENYHDWLNYTDTTNNAQGLLGRVINAINETYDLKLSISDKLSYERLYEKFTNGKTDGMFNCDETLMSGEYIRTDPIHRVYIKCFTNNPAYDSMCKLENLTAGTIYSQPSVKLIDRYYPALKINKKFYHSRDEMLSDFFIKKIDFIFTTREIYSFNDKIYSFYLPLFLRDYVITFKNGSDYEPLVSIINKAIKHFSDSGKMEMLKTESRDSFNRYIMHKRLNLSLQEKEWLSGHKTIKILMPEDYAPAFFIDADDRPRGICFDILKTILSALDIEYEIYRRHSNRWDQVENELKDGRFDIIPFIVKTDSRSKNIIFTKIYGYTDYIILSPSDTRNISSLHELDGKKIAVIEGEWVYEQLKNYFYSCIIMQKPNITEALKSVSNGESDYAICSKNLLTYRKSDYLEKLKIAGTYQNGVPVRFGVNRAHPELASILDKMIFTIDINDYLNVYNPDRLKEKNYFYLVYIVSGLMLVLTVSIIISCRMRAEIAKRKSAESKLRKSNRELLDVMNARDLAYKEKNEFFANISHDIRTPLNSILGFCDLLMVSIHEEKLRYYIDTMHTSGELLLNIIDDILDIAKLDENRIEIKNAETDIIHCLKSLHTMFNAETAKKNLEFILDTGSDIPRTVFIDEKRFNQIIMNLIANAIKFTDRGYIKISAGGNYNPDGGFDLIIKIEDTGIGIKDEYRDKIFKTFQHYISDGNRNTGAGLGLSICKRLTELMNGDITYASHPDGGTAFTVIFHGLKNSNKPAGDKSETDIDITSVKFNNTRILIADDVETNRVLLKALLQKLNCEIYVSENGLDALRQIKIIHPDAVIMDIWMPEMNGIEATRLIKNDPEIKNIPVIALTASVKKEMNQENLGLFNDYLIKPIKLSKIIEALINIIKPSAAVNGGETAGTPGTDRF